MAINLAKTIGRAFAKHGKPIGVKSATLTLYTQGARTAGAVSAGKALTATTYACKGIVDSFSSHQIDGTLVKTEDVMISLFASTIESGAIPVPGGKITIDGTTYRIVGGDEGKGVMRDPASAVYECHGRK